jgi:hypothetical protein
MLSFWTLIICAMTSARKAATASQASRSIRDHFALLLALAEARLDYALWRQAYRRIGWHPRSVALEVFPPSIDWSCTQKRLRDFAHAFRNMNAIVDSYVDHIRERFGISQRELMTARSFPLRHAASQRATLFVRALLDWRVFRDCPPGAPPPGGRPGGGAVATLASPLSFGAGCGGAGPPPAFHFTRMVAGTPR